MQRTLHAQARAALVWRARGSGAVEVLLLAAESRPAVSGLGTMLAEALFVKHAAAPVRVLLFASAKAVAYHGTGIDDGAWRNTSRALLCHPAHRACTTHAARAH